MLGASAAVAVAIIVIAWMWFHQSQVSPGSLTGAHWDLVMHTAMRWAVPTFFYVSIGAWLVQLLHAGIKRLRARLGW